MIAGKGLPGEGNGNPLQYFVRRTPWTEEPGGLQSMELQRVRHDLASEQPRFPGGAGGKQPVRETQVPSFGQEDPLEEEMATSSSILAWKTSVNRGVWRATVRGVAKSQT